MTPFIVLAKIPDLGPAPEGATTLFVAYFDTEQEALDAVRAKAPPEWNVKEVIGRAMESLVERRKIKPGTVEHL